MHTMRRQARERSVRECTPARWHRSDPVASLQAALSTAPAAPRTSL